MSSNALEFELLVAFGKIRRRLNLIATQALKPLGIGPKQALLLRALQEAKGALSLSEMAESTLTDPAATGRAIESLLKKGWVKQTDDPDDKRRWLVSLTKEGRKITGEVEAIYRVVAKEFCRPLSGKQKESLKEIFATVYRQWEDGGKKES